MTVELVGDSVPARSRDVTADDGRFRIVLPPAAPAPVEGATEARRAKAAAGSASVRMLDARGRVLYEDPVPLPTNTGSAYREYRIDERGAAPRDDYTAPKTAKRTIAKKPRKPPA